MRDVEIGVHLHARPGEAAELIRAAYAAGCRRFDAAIGGLGGCPFAQDELVGNLPTEILMQALKELGASCLRRGADDLIAANAEIARGFGECRAMNLYSTILVGTMGCSDDYAESS
jgi:hydroxymethylglutaryl-CoA lyase